MRDYKYTLAANGSDFKAIGGNFIKVKNTSADIRVIAENKNGNVLANIGMSGGTWIKLPERFETVRVENETGAVVTAELTIGQGEVDDSELTGAVSISGTLDATSQGATITAAAATVDTTAAVLLAVNTARRSVIIQNGTTGVVYVGAAGVTTSSGLKIEKGTSLVLDKSAGAEIHAVSDTASTDIRIFQELD